MSEVTGRALARSSLHVQAVDIGQMALRLLLTPVVIGRLGLEGYGLWVLLFSLCALTGALNTGIVWTYVKLTAELDQRRETAAMSEVVSSAAALMTVGAGLALALLWLPRDWLWPLLGVPVAALADAQRTFAVLALAVAVETSIGCTLYVLAGLQRIDLQYRFMLFGALLDFAAAFVLLQLGAGMVALAAGTLLGRVLSAAAAWRACRSLRPQLALSPLRASLDGMRRVLPLAFRLQGVVLASTLAREGTRLAISALFGAATLGVYQLGDRLLVVARSPVTAMLNPLMPAFARLAARDESDRRRALFRYASTITAAGAALSVLFAAVFADVILRVWTGREFPEAAWTARVLAPAEMAGLLTGVAVAALRASGTVGLELRAALVSGGLVLGGIAVGYPIGGYAGSIVAVCIGRCAASAWLLRGVPAAWIGARGAHLGRTVFGTAAFAVPVVFAANALCGDFLLASGRWLAAAVIAALAFGCALLVGGATWLLLLSKEDRQAVNRA